ncbi:MAG: type I 3-dehydroquinate dehydratase [Phycisphaerales bacterium JB059]
MGTLLCAPMMVREIDLALLRAREAKDAGADLVEYRLDELCSGDPGEIEQILALVRESPLPCIVTCRPTWEGGVCDADDMTRVALFEALGTSDHPPAYIDVELAAYTRSANLRQKVNLAIDHAKQTRDVRTSLVLSAHDFDGRPADLTRRVLAMSAEHAAAVHKVAFRARSLRDNLELFDLLRDRSKPMIALGMGEFGLMSRVLAPKFGAFLTFASVHKEEATAPGQPTIRELLDLYRFRSIGPETRVYGVIGWPVGHSMSPLVHNAGFEGVGHDGVYLPLPIAAGEPEQDGAYESFKATLLAMIDHRDLDLSGASVTIPHKQSLVRLAREQDWSIDPLSDRCAAANTITIQRDEGQLRVEVSNTDAPAAAACLHAALGGLAGKRVAIIGAGGVARAIAAGVTAQGARALIVNRSPERANALREAIGPEICDVRTMDDLVSAPPDAIVNATPVGMRGGPAPDESPLPMSVLDACRPGTVVFDTVYNPIETPLLRTARERGRPTIDGVARFVRQAALQFEEWTGRVAPTGLFERIISDELA